MNILVCIKDVPESTADLAINAAAKWVHAHDRAEYRMNRFDEYALEAAVRIKESIPDTRVDALSVGPDRIRATIRRAMAKGADNGIHIRRETAGYADAFTIASLIAQFAGSESYDLIFTGVMAEDNMQGLVGPLVAVLLRISCATAVVHQVLSLKEQCITTDCEMEGGLTETAVLQLPALLTVQTGMNRPRYPSLSNMLRARSQELITVDADRLAREVARTTVHSVGYPPKSSQCTLLEGTADEKASALLQVLHEKSLLRLQKENR